MADKRKRRRLTDAGPVPGVVPVTTETPAWGPPASPSSGDPPGPDLQDAVTEPPSPADGFPAPPEDDDEPSVELEGPPSLEDASVVSPRGATFRQELTTAPKAPLRTSGTTIPPEEAPPAAGMFTTVGVLLMGLTVLGLCVVVFSLVAIALFAPGGEAQVPDEPPKPRMMRPERPVLPPPAPVPKGPPPQSDTDEASDTDTTDTQASPG